jgi:hypothetical protein
MVQNKADKRGRSGQAHPSVDTSQIGRQSSVGSGKGHGSAQAKDQPLSAPVLASPDTSSSYWSLGLNTVKAAASAAGRLITGEEAKGDHSAFIPQHNTQDGRSKLVASRPSPSTGGTSFPGEFHSRESTRESSERDATPLTMSTTLPPPPPPANAPSATSTAVSFVPEDEVLLPIARSGGLRVNITEVILPIASGIRTTSIFDDDD